MPPSAGSAAAAAPALNQHPSLPLPHPPRYGDTNELWNSLDGIFACVIWDERTGTFCAARDPIGICSLYWGRADDGSVWFASEMKALQDHCKTIDCFPPVRARQRRRRRRRRGSAGSRAGAQLLPHPC